MCVHGVYVGSPQGLCVTHGSGTARWGVIGVRGACGSWGVRESPTHTALGGQPLQVGNLRGLSEHSFLSSHPPGAAFHTWHSR